MSGNKLLKLTSTPLDIHQEQIDDGDSGYHSNISGINSSVDSSLIISKTRSLIQFNTPENCLDVDSALGSNEPSEYDKPKQSSGNSRYRTTRPYLVGREHVDFLYYLGEKNNYSLILKRILSYLEDEDLYNVGAVSRSWKSIILSVPNERKRLRQYARKIENSKENRVAHACEDKNYQSPRTMLMQIQNIGRSLTSSNSSSSSATPPVSRTNYRFEAYQKEGRKLKSGERLFPCPKCKLPSHVDQQFPERAQCTNTSCKYRFCFLCQCEEHPGKVCDFISTPVVRKQSCKVGTLNSKRNLKRLLM